MQDFTFCSPTQFIFGRDAHLQVGEVLAKRGVARVGLHYGTSYVQRSGVLDEVRGALTQAGISTVELGGVRANPEVGLTREFIDLLRLHQCDFVLAVGGGSVIDSAKAAACGVNYDGDVWDLYQKKLTPTWEVLPVGAVLTIPAAGSEASASSVLSNDALGLKSGYRGDFLRPVVAFMNPELTTSLPAHQTGAGIVDIYAHIAERYFSNSNPAMVSDGIAVALFKTLLTYGPVVMRDPKNYEARANIMWASTLAHNGLAGLGRAEDWTSHALEHEISAFNPAVTHGAGLALVMPAWMCAVYREWPERFATYGRDVFGLAYDEGDDPIEVACKAIEHTKAFMESMVDVSNLAAWKITEADHCTLLQGLKINKGDAMGSFKVFTLDDAAALYRSIQ